MRVSWLCPCGNHNSALYPSRKDLSSGEATGKCFGLSELELFRSQASTIEAIGIRKCNRCKQKRALIFIVEHPSIDAFSYTLDSDIGKKIIELLKKRRRQGNE